MKHSDFSIGCEFCCEFYCGSGLFRCTDIGTRTVVAIRLAPLEIGGSEGPRRLSKKEAEGEGWFNGGSSGLSYACGELVFDECDQAACHLA